MGLRITWAVFLVGLLAPAMGVSAQENAWIGWCPQAGDGGMSGRSQPVFQPQGDLRWLTLGTGEPDGTCVGKRIPVAMDHVLWFGPLPGGAGPSLREIRLHGTAGPAKFDVSEIQFAAQPSPPQSALRPPPLTGLSKSPAPAPVRATMRSAWAWRPADWRESAASLLERLQRRHVRAVYVTVPMRDGAVEQPDLLGRFIAAATRKGIAVWTVIGDPQAVLPSERGRFAQWAQSYAAYNAASPPKRRLAGLQLDIEPYLLPGYAQDPAAWDAAYVETVNAIAQAGQELPVEVAVPVWFGSPIRLKRVLDRLAPGIQTITIMDYRTDERQIVAGAVPFLTWARDRGKAVRIAIEFGSLPDEEIRTYQTPPGQTGELWQIPFAAGQALVLLDHPVQLPEGRPLAFKHQAIVPGRALTFHGIRDHAARIVQSLETEFAVWPSFLGIAIHGMD